MGLVPACLWEAAGYSQAVDHRASFPTLPLPLVHLSEQAEEGLLGVGNVAVRRPAEELELAHHQLALLELNMEQEGKQQENNQPRLSFNKSASQRLSSGGASSRPCFSAPGAARGRSPPCFFRHADCEIYERTAVRERGPCVFITPLWRS